MCYVVCVHVSRKGCGMIVGIILFKLCLGTASKGSFVAQHLKVYSQISRSKSDWHDSVTIAEGCFRLQSSVRVKAR